MGSIVSSVLGMDNGMQAGGEAVQAGERFAKDVYFKPYTMTTGQGTTSYTDGQYTAELSDPNKYLQAQAQLGMAGLLPQYYQGASQAPSTFDFTAAQNAFDAKYDPSAEVSRIFEQESALLTPKFEQQAANLQSQLFGSGRLGAKLASAEAGGMVNPEAYGLQRAQQQTLAEVAASATQRGQEAAMSRFTTDLQRAQEQRAAEQQRYDISSGAFGINEALRQQRLENLLGGYETMFKTSLGTGALENELMKLGIDAESARAMAAASAGQIGTSGYTTQAQAGMAQDKAMGSLFGGIASGVTGWLLK